MAGPVEIIQLESHDDVTSVRDRLAFVGSNRVLLVWPPEGRVLSRKLDLVLLQREARRRAARLALVTQDPEVINNARELNISAFPSIEESRQQRWRRGRSKVFVDRSDRPESEPDPADLRDSASRLRTQSTPSQITLRYLFGAVVLLALACALLGAAAVVLPAATVTLTPAREHLDITIRVVADPAATDADIENGVIPATLLRVEIEESAQVETTGSLQEEPTPAGGTVVFTNQTGEAVTIPAGTTVSTSAGAIVRFRTLEAVNIAGQEGAIAVVAVEALPEFAGPGGNVPAYAIDHIDGPLGQILAVQNLDPLSGGSVPVDRVVSQADHDRLLAAVRQAIQQRALGDLTPLLGEGQRIIPESIRIVEERPEWTLFSAPVGERADAVSLTMRATVQAVVIDERMANQVALAGLAVRIPPGQVLTPNTMTFSRGRVEAISETGGVTFLANVTSDVISAVDVAGLQQALAGRSHDAALDYLYQHVELAPGIPPRIVIWPEFFGQMPPLPGRIKIVVREIP